MSQTQYDGLVKRFLQLLTKYRLREQADQLLQSADPCFMIRRARDDTPAKPGSSRVGGAPDLPAGVAWPESQGEPLAFVAQINLRELPFAAKALPERGILYFFVGGLEATGGDHCILYVHEGEASVESASSIESPPAPGEWAPQGIRFEQGLSLRSVPYDAELFDDMDAFREELQGGESHLLGCPYEGLEQMAEDMPGDAGQWELLLQLDSFEPHEDMVWLDNGKLAFFVKRITNGILDVRESLACVLGFG